MKDQNAEKRAKRYARKFANKIDVNCCEHKGSALIRYQIGYIGLRCCKVAVCMDCEERQIICGGLAKRLLMKFLRKGIRRVNVLATITMRDMFIYR